MVAGPWIGKWDLVSSDNFDEYLKAVGVGMIKRKLAASTKPSIIYKTESNGKITQRIESTLKTIEVSFTPGQEFEEDTADDRKAKAVVTIDGNKLVHKQQIDKLEAVTVREFNADEMVATSSAGSAVAVRKFKKVA